MSIIDRNFSPLASKLKVVLICYTIPLNEVDSLNTVSIKPTGQWVAMQVKKLAKSFLSFLWTAALSFSNPLCSSSSAESQFICWPLGGRNCCQSATCLHEASKVYSQCETSSRVIIPSEGFNLYGFAFEVAMISVPNALRV